MTKQHYFSANGTILACTINISQWLQKYLIVKKMVAFLNRQKCSFFSPKRKTKKWNLIREKKWRQIYIPKIMFWTVLNQVYIRSQKCGNGKLWRRFFLSKVTYKWYIHGVKPSWQSIIKTSAEYIILKSPMWNKKEGSRGGSCRSSKREV